MVAEEPTNPLETSTKEIIPLFVIGSIFVVPNPTLIISIYSLSILRMSLGEIVDIPLKANIEDAILICPPFPDKICDIGVYNNGYWTKLSIVIIAFSFFLNISSWWALPCPLDVNVTPSPNAA